MTWSDEQKQTFELNRLSWDERVEAHWASDMYRRHAADLRGGRPCLAEHIVRDVGDVAGKTLAHLQCHMGMETLSWALLGADVAGLDFSQPAIEKAELLGGELKLDAHFVCANVYDAHEALGRTFDIVFISVGAVCWLPDIDRWAQVVGSLLEPGGRLYMNEAHPFADVFDDHPDEPGIVVKYPYLDQGGLVFDSPGTYADLDAQFQHTKTVDHIHTIGSTLNALIRAGLVIDHFSESARCVWPRFKVMEQNGPDDWSLPGPVLNKLPNMYTLMAHKGG